MALQGPCATPFWSTKTMKRLAFALIGVLIVTATARAETMYVGDIVKITLRTGPGIDHKIITMVQSGTQVEVLEPDIKWTRVRLKDGREGWVLNRFLTSELPNLLVLEKLKQDYELLKTQCGAPMDEISKLTTSNKDLSAQLKEKEDALLSLKTNYDSLKKDSAQYLSLQTTYKQTTALLAEQTKKAREFEKNYRALATRQSIIWFLCGAGVLIIGFIIGVSMRSKKRSSYY
jgi:SH3 domain protein